MKKLAPFIATLALLAFGACGGDDDNNTAQNNCGNQFAFGVTSTYEGLAGALADDQLIIDTSQATCNQYLAVELNLFAEAGLADCGGRTPNYDVVDVSYSALAAGAATGVGDGVDSDDATHSLTDFPYLAAPQ